MSNRRKGILYNKHSSVRKFQAAGKLEDPTSNYGTAAGNMMRKVSGYGKNLMQNSQTWGDGSRINARRAKKSFDTNASLGQKVDATSARLTGDPGGFFKNQSDKLQSPTIGSMAFKPKPGNSLSPNNFTFKDNKIQSNQPTAMQAAGNAAVQPAMDKGNAAIDAIGQGTQGVASSIKPSGGLAGNAGAISAAGNLAGSAAQSISDDKNYTHSGKETAGTIGGGMLKGASMGLSIGAMMGPAAPIGAVGGAVIGAVGGLISGLVKNKKKKKEANNNLSVKTTRETNQGDSRRLNDLMAQEQNMATAPLATSYALPAATNQFTSRKTGGTFKPMEFTESTHPNRIIKGKAADVLVPKKFKRGGSIKPTENIIPAGVLHEEKNELGDKGMPVVKCKDNSCEKKYEIEKDEMIFTLSATKQTEALVGKKDYSNLGKFVKAQILDNTHSFTDKYKDLNNL